MEKYFKQALEQIGDLTPICKLASISGGCINRAYYIRTSKREYFAKVNNQRIDDLFDKEIAGIETIRKTGTIQVPIIYGKYQSSDAQYQILIMEWIEGKESRQTEKILGKKLAQLHQTTEAGFGLDENNYIGILPQMNTWYTDWLSFYRQQRLGIQMKIGVERGVISGRRLHKLEKLIERLDQWIPAQVTPSLIHGDLWSGNRIVGKHGEPFLIDPAVYFAHHEVELAFTELFGGFSSYFYSAYQDVFPLSSEYRNRKKIYQLYYLLVHLNLFGEGYGRDVDQILDYYL
jgi:fructosamine-3-kinase